MENRIGIAKAAKMLGIDRAELNERLLSAGIESFEGEVDFESVKRIAPSLNLSESKIMRRVKYIRENCAKLSELSPGRSTEEELECQLQKMMTELMVETRRGDRYRHIIDDVIDKLGELQKSEDERTRELALELSSWLVDEIEA